MELTIDRQLNSCDNCSHKRVCSLKETFNKYLDELNKVEAPANAILAVSCAEFTLDTPISLRNVPPLVPDYLDHDGWKVTSD